MKFKTKESLKNHVEALGLADISKMSSINHLARKNVGIDGLIVFDSKIKELECGLWSLLPLGLDEKGEIFDHQVDHLTTLFNSIINIGKAIKSFTKE